MHNPPETPQDETTPDSPIEDEEKRESLAEKKTGRRKINIEFIEDKSRRHITFSKRKAGIMKKAYELSTLTGTQVLLLVASETGHVYTFATPKLQPLITKAEGKNLIQSCLNAQEPAPPQLPPVHPRNQGSYSDSNMLYPGGEGRENQIEPVYDDDKKDPKPYPVGVDASASYQSSGTSYSSPGLVNSVYSMPSSMIPSTSRNSYIPSGQYPSPVSGSQYPPPPSNGQGGYQYNPAYGMPPGLPPAPWNMKSSLLSHPQSATSTPNKEHQAEHG